MNSELQNNAVKYTRRIMEGIWAGDLSLYEEYASEKITGIGSMESEYTSGRDKFGKLLKERSEELGNAYLDGENFQVISDDTNSCIVAGEYDVCSQGHMIKKQRVTAVWDAKRKKLTMSHLQFTDVQKNLTGPAHEFTRALTRRKEEQTMLPLKDHNGKLYMLEPADIEWIESARNYVVIRRADGGDNLKIRTPFADFIRTLPSQFLTVSRGKNVNMDYVDSFSRNVITLIDGTTFRVSRSCQDDVMEKMRKIHTIFEEEQ